MAPEDDDDLYDDDYDFVDDEEDADNPSDVDEEAAAPAEDESPLDEAARGVDVDEEPVDEYGRPEPKADYVVHVYEQRKFKRTIERPFTPEDAEAFASEYNRTAKSYGRFAVTGKNDAKPKKSLD
jgi:hypothetical protein